KRARCQCQDAPREPERRPVAWRSCMTCVRRRQFIGFTVATLAAGVAGACASRAENRHGATDAVPSQPLDAAAFRATRRLAETPFGKIAYLERGSGEAALFLHGAPLNSFQWRGALDRL